MAREDDILIRSTLQLADLARSVGDALGLTFTPEGPYFVHDTADRSLTLMADAGWDGDDLDDFTHALEVRTPDRDAGATATVLFDRLVDQLPTWTLALVPNMFNEPPAKIVRPTAA